MKKYVPPVFYQKQRGGTPEGKDFQVKLITRDADYAIRALCYIARQKAELVSVNSVINELKVPRPFIRKILQILTKSGLLNSFKGKGGGFSLAKSAENILVTDVIGAFHASFSLYECIFRRRICPEIKICELRKKLDEIEKSVIKKLQSITIASLIFK